MDSDSAICEINLHGGVVERVTVSRLLTFLVVPRHDDGNWTFAVRQMKNCEQKWRGCVPCELCNVLDVCLLLYVLCDDFVCFVVVWVGGGGLDLQRFHFCSFCVNVIDQFQLGYWWVGTDNMYWNQHSVSLSTGKIGTKEVSPTQGKIVGVCRRRDSKSF